MSTHTPGPWMVPHFARDEVKCDCGYVFSEFQHGMGSICEVNFGSEDEPLEVAKANARLIAAAPDLLEALSAIVAADDEGELDQRHIEIARAVLAKAEGQP